MSIDYVSKKWDLKSECGRVRFMGVKSRTAYAQAGYAITEQWKPFVRYDTVRIGDGSTPETSQKTLSLGLTYKLNDSVALRIEDHMNRGYALPYSEWLASSPGSALDVADAPSKNHWIRWAQASASSSDREPAMKQHPRWGAVLALWACLSAPAFCGDMVVIVNKANAQAIDLAFVTKVYTGTAQSWTDGSPIVVFDQNDEAVRGSFAAMFGKTAGNLKSTWANLMFSGKATPPKMIGGDAEVKAAVSANKSAIGYINAASVDASVKGRRQVTVGRCQAGLVCLAIT